MSGLALPPPTLNTALQVELGPDVCIALSTQDDWGWLIDRLLSDDEAGRLVIHDLHPGEDT